MPGKAGVSFAQRAVCNCFSLAIKCTSKDKTVLTTSANMNSCKQGPTSLFTIAHVMLRMLWREVAGGLLEQICETPSAITVSNIIGCYAAGQEPWYGPFSASIWAVGSTCNTSDHPSINEKASSLKS